MRKLLGLLILLIASPVGAQVVTPATGGGGVISVLNVTSHVTGATYTVPTGAKRVEACFTGGGGGGSGVTSGTASATGGCTGAAGAAACVRITGAALAATWTYDVQTGGTPGTCSAAPSAGGNATGSSDLKMNGVQVITVAGGAAGTTPAAGANCTPAPSGGSAPSSALSFLANPATLLVFNAVAGVAGRAGNGDVALAQTLGGGGYGGNNGAITAAGACDGAITITAGADGTAIFTAYSN